NLVREVAIAFGNGVEAGLGAERRKPGRPDMGRNEVGMLTRFQGDLEKIAGIEAQDRPAVRGDVADSPKACGKPVHRLEVRRVDQMMDLSRPVALLVDRGDLDREHEAYRRHTRWRQRLPDLRFQLGLEAEQSTAGWHQLVPNLSEPSRMHAIPGANEPNPLSGRPPRHMLKVEVPAGRPRVFGVHMQVPVKAHGYALSSCESGMRHDAGPLARLIGTSPSSTGNSGDRPHHNEAAMVLCPVGVLRCWR